MTELERARAHLRKVQDNLAFQRRYTSEYTVQVAEDCVLAALSWVFEEQERCDGEFVFPRQHNTRRAA